MTDFEREALDALRAVVRGSTRPMGQDSTGQSYCHIREASLKKATAVLALLEATAAMRTRAAAGEPLHLGGANGTYPA